MPLVFNTTRQILYAATRTVIHVENGIDSAATESRISGPSIGIVSRNIVTKKIYGGSA